MVPYPPGLMDNLRAGQEIKQRPEAQRKRQRSGANRNLPNRSTPGVPGNRSPNDMPSGAQRHHRPHEERNRHGTPRAIDIKDQVVGSLSIPQPTWFFQTFQWKLAFYYDATFEFARGQICFRLCSPPHAALEVGEKLRTPPSCHLGSAA